MLNKVVGEKCCLAIRERSEIMEKAKLAEYRTTAYASGDASITTYKLGARQDDSYISTFKSTGWWNADRLRDN